MDEHALLAGPEHAAREQAVTRAFVSIATALVGEYDIADLHATLTRACAEILGVASAGLLLVDRQGKLQLAAASSEHTRNLEVFLFQREQGPCLDCFRDGVAVSVADLSMEHARWPQFVPTALAAGFVSVHAVPMHLRGATLGTLGLFGTTVGALSTADLELGQALADVASVTLVADRTSAHQARVEHQLQAALDSRVVIEQAKGQLAELGRIDMPHAFAVMRRYARDHNERLSEVARQLVARELEGAVLLEYARAKDVRPA